VHQVCLQLTRRIPAIDRQQYNELPRAGIISCCLAALLAGRTDSALVCSWQRGSWLHRTLTDAGGQAAALLCSCLAPHVRLHVTQFAEVLEFACLQLSAHTDAKTGAVYPGSEEALIIISCCFRRLTKPSALPRVVAVRAHSMLAEFSVYLKHVDDAGVASRLIPLLQ
jgi:hypothetical protein